MASRDVSAELAQLRRGILDAIRPFGYRAHSGRFVRSAGSDWTVISLLTLERAAPGLKFVTADLGVYVDVIGRALNQRVVGPPRARDCHWKRRLGVETPREEDSWWALTDDPRAVSATLYSGPAVALIGELVEFGVPALEAHANKRVLLEAWRTAPDLELGRPRTMLYAAILAGELEGAAEAEPLLAGLSAMMGDSVRSDVSSVRAWLSSEGRKASG